MLSVTCYSNLWVGQTVRFLVAIHLVAGYRGISLFKVRQGDDDWSKDWRKKTIAILKQYREEDTRLRQQIIKKNIFICERHYKPEDINLGK